MNKDIKITRDQFFEFIKKDIETPQSMSRSTKHYLDYFDKVKMTGRKINWNWAAFLPAVFFYRRMFAIGISVLGVGRLLDKLLSLLFARVSLGGWEDTVDLTVAILFIALCMGYTDYMYLQHANHQILKGKLRGGVSPLALGMWVVLLIAGVCLLILKLPPL